MRLLKLRIENFKGIDRLEITPDGNSLKIFGANAKTKTSIADAGHWLLTDKDSKDRSTQLFTIKPREVLESGELGDEIIGKEPCVEGEYLLSDGRKKTFKKEHLEKWNTVRGHSEEILTGFTTQHYVDGAKTSATEYNEAVEAIIEKELIKQLTNPLYVANVMKKAERRELLIRLTNIDVEDVLQHNSELSGYHELLADSNHDTVLSRLKDRKEHLNKELGTRRTPGQISGRIDENQRKIVEVDQPLDEVSAGIKSLKEKKADIEQERSQVRAGGGVAELNVKVQEIEAEKASFVNKFNVQVEENLKDVRQKVADLENKVDESEADLRVAKREYALIHDDYKQSLNKVDEIQHEIESEQQRQPDPRPEQGPDLEECPMCGQAMPEKEDDHEDHYQQYLEKFNSEKASNLKKLKERLEFVQNTVDDLGKALKEKEAAGAKVRAKDSQRKEALEKAQAELGQKKEASPSASDQPEYQKLEADKQALLSKISEIKSNRQIQVDEVQNRINEVEEQISELQKAVTQHEKNQECLDRIAELSTLKKKYGAELIEVEDNIRLLEDFTRTKCELIEEEVNAKFNLVSWRLFKNQQNGGIEERCDAVYKSQPWDDLSTSEEIKCGLDIINTLSKHYGKSVPIWLDNRESTTEIPDTDLQTISLIVSPEDKKLRVEVEQEEKAVA